MSTKQYECPYCGALFGRLVATHMKKHGKTMDEVRKEFPNIPLLAYGFPKSRATGYPPVRKIK